MLTLEHEANKYFKTNVPLKETPEEEEQFEQYTICWLCETSFAECEEAFGSSLDCDTASLALHEKVRDHDHLTGKYRGAAQNICNLKCKQKSSSFVPIFYHNFSGYDCHLIFEELLRSADNLKFPIIVIPKSKENYVSVQVGCLGFLDSYRFFSASLDNLV